MDGARALPTRRTRLQLVSEAAAGDSAAFDLLVREHGPRVFRLALRMLGSREEAEDIQQETFVRAHRKLRTFRGEAALGTWIYSIAAHLCLSRKRSSTWQREVALEEQPSAVSNPASDPEQVVLARESAARVQQALGLLAAPDRLLILLKYVEGLSHGEIARILGCSVLSSRSRLTRAKKLFRQCYEEVEG